MTDQQTAPDVAAARRRRPGRPPAAASDGSHARNFSAGLPRQARRSSPSSTPCGVYGILAAAAVQSWVIAAFLVLALVAVNWVYFSERALPGQVPRARAALPARLPGVRRGLHGLRRVHELRRRAQLRQGRRDRGDPRPERAPGRGLADATRSRCVAARRRARLRDRAGRRGRRSGTAEEPLAARRRRHGRGRPGHRRARLGRARASPQIAAAAGGGHRAAGAGLRRPERRLAAHAGRLDRLRLRVDARLRRGRRHHDRHRRPARSTRPTTTATSSSADGEALTAGLARDGRLRELHRVLHATRGSRPFLQILVWTFAFAILSVRHHVRARAVPRDRVQRPAGQAAGGSTARC